MQVAFETHPFSPRSSGFWGEKTPPGEIQVEMGSSLPDAWGQEVRPDKSTVEQLRGAGGGGPRDADVPKALQERRLFWFPDFQRLTFFRFSAKIK